MAKVERDCKWCTKPYTAETRELNRGQGLFCSIKCAGEYKTANRPSKVPNTECAWCQKSFYRKPSTKKAASGLYFCSVGHKNEAVRDADHPLRTGPASEKPKNPECSEGCGRRTSRSEGVCFPCQTPTNKAKWLAGDVSASYVGKNKDPAVWVKQHLIETRGDRCEECRFDKKAPDGRSIIQMDHIDGNYLNNSPSNLKLLCPNCHAMTETYGRLNKRGGRAYRRKEFR